MENLTLNGWMTIGDVTTQTGLSRSRVMALVKEGRIQTAVIPGVKALFCSEESVSKIKVHGRSGRPTNEALGKPVSDQLLKVRAKREAKKAEKGGVG